MLRFRSLTAKFIFMGIIVLAFIAAYIIATYIFTHHMKGEARRLNFTGKERMVFVDIARHLLEMADTPPSEERANIIEHLKQEINMYEEVLFGLRDGSEKHDFAPIPSHAKEAVKQNNKLIDMWQKVRKPEILRLIEIPDKVKVREHSQLLYVHMKEIDKLAALIENHSAKEIKDFDTCRYYAFGFFFVLAFLIIFYIRQSIIKPVWRLRDATKEIEKGNFDISVDIKSRDEIGELSEHFTHLARTLDISLAENTSLIKNLTDSNENLTALNEIAHAASQTLTVEVMLNSVLDAILTLGRFKLKQKGAIFLYEERKVLRLIVARNFSNEHAKLCSSVPFGECLCGIAAEKGEMLISGSNYEDARHSRTYPGAEEHGHMILPLKSRDKMLGVLCLYLPSETKLSDAEIDLYKSIAEMISIATQNAINHRQVALLAQSLDSSIDLITITDPEGTIIHANPQVYEYLGYTQDEIKGINVSVMQSPKNPVGLGEEIYNKTVNEGGWAGEVINIRKDGTEYPVFLTTSPVKDDGGNISALIGIARDITERVQTETKLRESERRHHMVMENVQEIIYMVAVSDGPFKGQVQLVSDYVEKVTGYTKDDFMGNPELWFSIIHPDDIPSVTETTKRMHEEKQPVVRNYRIRNRATGKYRWLEDGVVPLINEKGEVIFHFGVVRDVTESREAERAIREGEERLQAIIDNSTAVIYLKDPEGRYLLVNSQWEPLFHISKEQMVGKTDYESFPKCNPRKYISTEKQRYNDLNNGA